LCSNAYLGENKDLATVLPAISPLIASDDVINYIILFFQDIKTIPSYKNNSGGIRYFS
jgi:hypothetical protein